MMFADVLRDFFHSGLGVIRLAENRYFGIPRVTTLPTATIDYRGALVRKEGATTVADTLHWCRKNTSDTYEWVTVDVTV